MSDEKKYKSTNINSDAIIRELRNLSSLLKDLLIVELAAKGVKQKEIRKIARVDINRVNRILKCFKT